MSRKGNPSSGILRRAQLRPKVHHLTPAEWVADLAIDKHDGISVPDLARAINRSELAAYRIAEGLIEKKCAVVIDRLLYKSRAHYRAAQRHVR